MYYQIINVCHNNIYEVREKIDTYKEVKKFFKNVEKYKEKNDTMYVRKVFFNDNKCFFTKWKILKNKSTNYCYLPNADEEKQKILDIKFDETMFEDK